MFEYCTRIEFCDIDKNNKATNTGLLRIMQESSNYHSDSIGYGIKPISEASHLWVLVSQRFKVFSRPGWASKVKIKTWSRGVKGAKCLRDFKMVDQNENVVCLLSTNWVMLDTKTGMIIKPKEDVMKAYGVCDESVFEDKQKRLRIPDESVKTFEYKIQKRDIDVNNHVNNLFYINFAYEALPDDISEIDFSSVEVEYKKETFLGDDIECFYSSCEDSYIVVIKSKKSSDISAIVKFKEM